MAYWICNNLPTNAWSKKIVTSNLEVPNKAIGSDFDLGGDIDIVVMSQLPGKLMIFENHNFNWTQKTLTNNFQNAAAISVIDLDQDGDEDIVAGAGVDGDLIWWENKYISSTPVNEANNMIINEFRLYQNYPNPFNAETTFMIDLRISSTLSLQIFDALGREIRTLIKNEFYREGQYRFNFDASSLMSGI